MSDTLTLTIRLHDPKEKQDVRKSNQWLVIDVPRADLSLTAEEFTAKYGSAIGTVLLRITGKVA